MTSITEKEPTRRGGRGARMRILNAASELFYFEGINATGVGRIASKASVSKRTLYQHFPSKTVLVEEYLRQLRQEAGTTEGTSVEMSPRGQLLALFDIAEGGDARMRGCPFHNAAVEAADAMPGVEHIVHLHKRDYVEGLTHLAREAGAADPEMLGNQVALLYEGASALSTSLNDPRPGRVPEPRRRPSSTGQSAARSDGPHFDVVAAAKTASVMSSGIGCTLGMRSRLLRAASERAVA